MEPTAETPADSMRSYGLVAAMKKVKGSAWLGQINGGGRRTLWEWDGGSWSAARADFVLPRYDAELDALLIARYRTEYKGVEGDAVLVEAILDRVASLGGQLLQG